MGIAGGADMRCVGTSGVAPAGPAPDGNGMLSVGCQFCIASRGRGMRRQPAAVIAGIQTQRSGARWTGAAAEWRHCLAKVGTAARGRLVLVPECAAVLGFIMLLWVSISMMLAQQYEAAQRAAYRDTGNLARAFEENTARIITGIDQILLSMRASYADHPDGFDVVGWQHRQALSDRFTLQFVEIGPEGLVRASTMGGANPTRVDLSDREHFRVHLDPNRDELFISKPVKGRISGKWTVEFTRKLLRADGNFGGVLVVSLGCDELSRFYETLDLGHGMVALAGMDGIIRARGPRRTDVIGSDLSAQPFFADLGSGATHGNYQGEKPDRRCRSDDQLSALARPASRCDGRLRYR